MARYLGLLHVSLVDRAAKGGHASITRAIQSDGTNNAKHQSREKQEARVEKRLGSDTILHLILTKLPIMRGRSPVWTQPQHHQQLVSEMPLNNHHKLDRSLR